jgi:hypothetical protein
MWGIYVCISCILSYFALAGASFFFLSVFGEIELKGMCLL